MNYQFVRLGDPAVSLNFTLFGRGFDGYAGLFWYKSLPNKTIKQFDFI
jgi:hypothetical protein